MATTFNLVPETTGDYVQIDKLASKKNITQRPFTCYLDLGLTRATSGNRVFAAMKGAVDAGINIPHSDKIFPKVKTDKKEKTAKDDKSKSNPLRDRIMGKHIQNYMEFAKKKEFYKLQFSQWDKCLTENKAGNLEDLYKKIHAEIRKNPDRVKKAKKTGIKHEQDKKDKNIRIVGKKTYRRDMRLKRDERKKRVQDKLDKFRKSRQQS